VIGVSRDAQETSDRFKASLDLPFSLVGDPEERIIRAYGVRWPIVGLTQRVTYVIGRNRKVRLAFHSELDMDAHSAEVCKALAEQAPSA
jgi:peroxiredoxin Q/BCP